MLELRIAKPCDQSWTAMTGDEQVRHCRRCDHAVYNIAEMTEAEVEALIRRTEGRFCARIYRRSDSRVMTKDCPRGVAKVRRRRALAVTAAFGAAIAITSFPVMGQTKTVARRTLRTVKVPAPAFETGTPVFSEPETGKFKIPDARLGESTAVRKRPKWGRAFRAPPWH